MKNPRLFFVPMLIFMVCLHLGNSLHLKKHLTLQSYVDLLQSQHKDFNSDLLKLSTILDDADSSLEGKSVDEQI